MTEASPSVAIGTADQISGRTVPALEDRRRVWSSSGNFGGDWGDATAQEAL
jgi:hypothetical protein